MLLPKGLTLPLMTQKWASILNPFIANPSLSSSILKNISLINGTTVISHLLGRTLVGWRIIGINGAATIYDEQSTNVQSSSTLILVSNAAVIISLEVF